LKEIIKNKLNYLRGKCRKIFGPTKERDGIRKIKTNDELDKLIRHKKVHKSTKVFKLVWPFTSNVRRENG